MDSQTPTIKGIFVKSHINRIKKEKGDDGLHLLEEKIGHPLDFKNTDNVPLRDEVAILEAAVRILSKEPLPEEKVSLEAGKLHFNNFLTTPLAKILFPFFKDKFKTVMMQTQNIAGHVFEGVNFTSMVLGEKEVRITMRNNDYPIEHFQGFFQEWMKYSGLNGSVDAVKTDGAYEYTMRWE